MPMTAKGKKIMKAMQEEYGKKKGKEVFYASKAKGKIKGVEKKSGTTKSKSVRRRPRNKSTRSA